MADKDDSELLRAVPPSLPARIAQHVDVIRQARDRGIPWRRIVEVVGPKVDIDPAGKRAGDRMREGYVAAVRAVEKGRLKPRPQSSPTPAATTAAQRQQQPGKRLSGQELFDSLKI